MEILIKIDLIGKFNYYYSVINCACRVTMSSFEVLDPGEPPCAAREGHPRPGMTCSQRALARDAGEGWPRAGDERTARSPAAAGHEDATSGIARPQRVSAEAVLRSFNTWAFKREQP